MDYHEREMEIRANLENQLKKIAKCSVKFDAKVPKLIAVSKTMPVSDIKIAYEAGQRDFGENYVNELVEKVEKSREFMRVGDEIRWHYIGALQSNKIKLLTSLGDRLHCIQTVDNTKHAGLLDGHSTVKMKVMIQVNTSKEQQKSGVDPEQASSLAGYIIKNCRMLDLYGLMTIGAAHSQDDCIPEFKLLRDLKNSIDREFELDLELCMGMSADYEKAIEFDSTMVRIGTGIFGKRDYGNKK